MANAPARQAFGLGKPRFAAPAEPAGRGILDYPHYTRPQSFRGWDVPEVLVNGNHEEIRRWRREKALEKTRRNRPVSGLSKTGDSDKTQSYARAM